MFIVIEGLDASGKNTISQHISKELANHGYKSCFYDKNEYDIEKTSVKNTFDNLHGVIYEQENQADFNVYPRPFWVNIQSAWFNLQYNFGIAPKLEENIVICAGWYYKFIAKYIDKGINEEWIKSTFKFIKEPELIILLDL